jgi:hypothetical protein
VGAARQVWKGDGVVLPLVDVELARLHLVAAGGVLLLLLCCCGQYWRRRGSRNRVAPAAGGEKVPHSSPLAVLGWVCVYGATGCTAESSRVGTGGYVHPGAARLSGTPRAPALQTLSRSAAARTRSTGTELLTPP